LVIGVIGQGAGSTASAKCH